MEESQKVVQCYHCGNETLMNLLSEYLDDFDQPFPGYYKYRTYLCPVCKKVTLIELYSDIFEVGRDPYGKVYDVVTERTLYPQTSLNFSGIPAEVASAYSAALKCRNIDNAVCLMALRKTLEIVCQDKKAAGRDLWGKIEDLSVKGILPTELKHASTITRHYGNMGAHDTQVQVSRSDMDWIFEFVKYILDYLYVLPAKLKEMQEKMGRPQINNPKVGQVDPTTNIEETDDT